MLELSVQPGAVIADKYELEQALVQGSAGPVLAARHRLLDQRVAIEFLGPGRAQHAERLRRQAGAAAALSSEHLCRVLDICTAADGTPCVVSEYAEGPDLAQCAGLPHAEAVEYALQACEGLAEALAIGLSHGALRPELVYVTTRRDGSRCLKLLGIASGLADATPGADARALGELLEGMLGGDAANAPEELLAVVQRARAEHYASIGELAQALGPFASPAARGAVDRVSRFLQPRAAVDPCADTLLDTRTARATRHRLWAIGFVALGGLVAVCATPSTQQTSRDRHSVRSATETQAQVAPPIAADAPAQPPAGLEETAPLMAAADRSATTGAAGSAKAATSAAQAGTLARTIAPPLSAAGRRPATPGAQLPNFGGRR